jgi:signal transduction histidine kinase
MVLSILAGLVPAGIALDRRVARALEERARTDLVHAPRLLADRQKAYSDAQMMYAKEFAHLAGLAEAVARNDHPALLRIVEDARPSLGPGLPVVVGPLGSALVGAPLDSALLDATRRGEMPVRLSVTDDGLRNVAVAPLMLDNRWVGAVGLATPVDRAEAEVLKGLTRSDVILVVPGSRRLAATTLDSATAMAIWQLLGRGPPADSSLDLVARGQRFFVLPSSFGNAARVIFVRPAHVELAMLPAVRRTAAWTALLALVTALVLGAWLALRVSRPVRQLAAAATALRDEEFDAALPDSRIVEVARVAEQFAEMRRALRARLDELRVTNERLEDRNTRLVALQSDLVQRERLAATGRLITQLAHEIRNPVASLRNCLEVIRKRLAHDPEGLEFVDMAINELLRMHELAEQTLDAGRPRPIGDVICNPRDVALEVARLISAGVPASELQIEVRGTPRVDARIATDALKQILLNLVQNAREACATATPPIVPARVVLDVQDRAHVCIVVDDNGPGIPEGIESQVFDPFFSTKSAVNGVGLGLFVAQGLVRAAGGRMTAGEAPAGGARFLIELPHVVPAPTTTARHAHHA